MAQRNKKKLIIGAKNQTLTIAQANFVRDMLSNYYPEYEISIQSAPFSNDRIFNAPRFNPKPDLNSPDELEIALRSHTIDFAVRNLKNLPLQLPSDMVLAAYLPREDSRDALVGSRLKHILPSAVIGFENVLCAEIFKNMRPDIHIVIAIREISAIFERFRSGEFNAFVVSAADLKWMNLEREIAEYLDPRVHIPPAGQGVIVLETAASAKKIQNIVSKIHHEPTYYCAMAEIAFVRKIWQKYTLPASAHAEIIDSELHLSAVLAPEIGHPLYGSSFGKPENAERIGEELALIMVNNENFAAES